MSESGKYFSMYDVRGIQKYVFRTAKVKDAMGASGIVEDIIMEALKKSVLLLKEQEQKNPNKKPITEQLVWKDEKGFLEYKEEEVDIQVLFVGGGNAFVIYSSQELCFQINRLMSKYILEHTYSLQLAVAMVKKTEILVCI